MAVRDSVVITNKFQGLQGTIGTVIQVTASFVTIKTADGRGIVHGHQNVKRYDSISDKYF